MLARIAEKASCLLLLLLFSLITKAQLHASFNATPTSQCAPAVIQFTDSSTGNPTSWKWDLGNGTTSFLQNPSATYLTPGSYTVKLVVKNSAQSDSVTKTGFITVYTLPTAQFTSTDTTGCYPLPVQFTDQSNAGSGSIATWQWDFGDGFTSTQQNPSHIYENSGNFNVTLQVTNSHGCTNTIARNQYIRINTGVRAGFTNSSLNTCKPPVVINFQNTSTGTGALNYQWSFGDGNFSSATSPSYTYNSSGSFTVKLIATNSSGCSDTVTTTNAISVGNVKAAFSSGNDSVCMGNSISFKNTSTPSASSVLWSFGDNTSSTLANPVKNYSLSGIYQVKMVANFGACSDSAFKIITILPQPTTSFSGDDTTSCQAPLTVNFTNQSVNGVSYQWNFGDGATSNSQNPAHTYTTAGNYNVTLITTNANGCTDTLKKNAYIKIQLPKITFTNLPDSGCAPFTKAFNASISSLDSVVSYAWDFGDGTTSTIASPTHSFSSPGSYTIKLTITTAEGCTASATSTNGIVVTTPPTANFIGDPPNTCAKTVINFTDQSTGTSTHWLWNFGDGTTSTIENPSHIYSDTGFFNIQLISFNRGCPDTLKLLNYIHINPPIAKFTVTINCDSPYERIFTDKSIGANVWNWNFGDGTTSTMESPQHTYADTGTYVVTLQVINNTSGCDFTTSQTIRLVIAKANFYAADSVVCKGSPVLFTAPIGNLANVTAYSWTFGDGATSNTSTNSVSHTYNSPGYYNVSLVITNVLGCKDTLTKLKYIRVNGPTAKFGTSGPSVCLNSTVVFNDSSVSDGINPIKTWIWNYGDGKTDTLTGPPFQHLYAIAGVYSVSLTVIDSSGCTNSYKLPVSLIVSNPVAAFSSSDTAMCPNQPVGFINNSTGTNLSYLWSFGDSNTSTTIIPAHSYVADGAYTIKLLVTDKYGCTDSMVKPDYVNITTPIANFKMSDSVSTCPPLLVNFTNLSVNDDSVSWDFGDSTTSSINNPSHFYTYPGIYTATLTIIGPGGCSSQLQKKISILGPTGTFSYTPLNGCNPVNISFTATSKNALSFIWDFNDGTTVDTTGTNISHIYNHSGAYLPKLILSDQMGCHVPIAGIDTIHVYSASAKFGFIGKALCDSGTVSFTDSSTSNDNIVGYDWNFGDGDTSLSENPSHDYTKPGSYYPTLTVTTQIGCINTKISTSPVRIVASPQAAIISTGNGCTPLNATFKGQLLVSDTSAINWNWNFGNGNISSIQNPLQQTYSKSGVYVVQLKILNSTGCTDTTSTTIEAYIIPPVNAGGNLTICQNKGETLNGSGADTYSWSPATGLSCTNCATPVATPATVTV